MGPRPDSVSLSKQNRRIKHAHLNLMEISMKRPAFKWWHLTNFLEWFSNKNDIHTSSLNCHSHSGALTICKINENRPEFPWNCPECYYAPFAPVDMRQRRLPSKIWQNSRGKHNAGCERDSSANLSMYICFTHLTLYVLICFEFQKSPNINSMRIHFHAHNRHIFQFVILFRLYWEKKIPSNQNGRFLAHKIASVFSENSSLFASGQLRNEHRFSSGRLFVSAKHVE